MLGRSLMVAVTYQGLHHRSVAQVSRGEHGWWLEFIRTPARERQRGQATELLKAVCADADAHGSVVTLSVQPEGGGLTHGELVRWYERHGFAALGGGLMERQPRRRRRVA